MMYLILILPDTVKSFPEIYLGKLMLILVGQNIEYGINQDFESITKKVLVIAASLWQMHY